MMDRQADPSVGIDAVTGATLTGWDHVVQSLRDLFLTGFGERWHREFYGSLVPAALGRNITRAEMLPVVASITAAIEQWEPRFHVVQVTIDGDDARDGRLAIRLTGHYRPRALLGDPTDAGSRTLAVALGRGNLTIG